MNGLEAVAAVATRLRSQVPGRTVYEHGVPDGALPARYVVVFGSEGDEAATRACGTTNVQEPSVWVTSVSRNPDGHNAAREAAWGASRARTALRDYRPEGRWKFTPASSSPARRDEALSDTTFYAVEQFTLRSTI